ncbi:protein tweety homolog 3-like isoform X1 [Montipora foliosa]|uniref:protein tweety homolog 3-like isoform X1 n=1 Tax=Montipora foliosa TaxID=591990 RepID=UPI0035F18178
MAANCSGGIFINPPKIADFFHSLSHLNFDFNNVSSIFIPTLPDYQQVLCLYVIGPCIFGGVVFLIFCGHFAASCCSCSKLQRPKLKCAIVLRCILLLTSVLSSGFVIAAFVFNDTVHLGVRRVLAAADNVNDSFIDIQSKISCIKDDLLDLESNIVDLESCPGVTDVDHAHIHELRGYVDDIIISVVKIKKVDLPPVEDDVRDIEYIRWMSTFGTLCIIIVTCLLIIFAVLRGSRCGFVLGMIAGTVSLLLVWLSVGVDLALSVGMSDLCEHPKETLYHYVKDQLASKGIVQYYVECPIGEHNPYQRYADKAQSTLDVALDTFSVLKKGVQPLNQHCQKKLDGCNKNLRNSQTSLAVIIKNLDCKFVHQEFKSANCYVCEVVVNGIARLLLVSLIIGVLVIIILSLVLPIYHRIPKHRKNRNLFNLFWSDSPLGTPYQSISEDDSISETVPLNSSAPLPCTYNSVNHSSLEFHSIEESGAIRQFLTPNETEPLPASSAKVNPAPSNPVIPSTRGQITSMAF